MIQERDIEFYVDRRDAGETNQELYNLFIRRGWEKTNDFQLLKK
ncbi:hypothetical protein [Ligilactobacillus salivarius]|nr:hypothetical protein [Ligilactobacillus salivarius]